MVRILHTALSRYIFWLNSYLCFNCQQPNVQSRSQKEGTESEQFWNLLGGKSEYPSQKISRDAESDPHLFSCTFSRGLYNSSWCPSFVPIFLYLVIFTILLILNLTPFPVNLWWPWWLAGNLKVHSFSFWPVYCTYFILYLLSFVGKINAFLWFPIFTSACFPFPIAVMTMAHSY